MKGRLPSYCSWIIGYFLALSSELGDVGLSMMSTISLILIWHSQPVVTWVYLAHLRQKSMLNSACLTGSFGTNGVTLWAGEPDLTWTLQTTPLFEIAPIECLSQIINPPEIARKVTAMEV